MTVVAGRMHFTLSLITVEAMVTPWLFDILGCKLSVRVPQPEW